MIKVLFICHGNICRSTMAQSVFQHMVDQQHLTDCFHIDSAATSTEEIGNSPHHGTVRKLQQVEIPLVPHRARQITKKDYESFDYVIGMDQWNLRNLRRMFKNDPQQKISLLLDYTSERGDIADPWYTGNFDVTYEDVVRGCEGFLKMLRKENLL